MGHGRVGHAERTEVDTLLIAGPTASGKSALALRLAERLGGVVVNADSMQVYRDLRLLSARPDPADEARAPHALFGHVDGACAYSVNLWLADMRAALAAARDAGRLPIVVGGTGLYLKALTQGLSEIPPVPTDVRAEVRAWAEGKLTEDLYTALTARDPLTAARLRPTDPQRIVRALEVHAATGVGLATFQEARQPPVLDATRSAAVSLAVDRAILWARVDVRFDRMIAAGALDEAAALASRRLDPTLPVMRAIGVPPLIRHLTGEISKDAAIAEAKAASRQYIKRQETFARHQLPAFRPLPPKDAEAALLAACQSS